MNPLRSLILAAALAMLTASPLGAGTDLTERQAAFDAIFRTCGAAAVGFDTETFDLPLIWDMLEAKAFKCHELTDSDNRILPYLGNWVTAPDVSDVSVPGIINFEGLPMAGVNNRCHWIEEYIGEDGGGQWVIIGTAAGGSGWHLVDGHVMRGTVQGALAYQDETGHARPPVEGFAFQEYMREFFNYETNERITQRAYVQDYNNLAAEEIPFFRASCVQEGRPP